MAKRKAARRARSVSSTIPKIAYSSAAVHHPKQDVGWEEAMKLGIVGLVGAFAVRVFVDTYFFGELPDYNFALYHGIVFGAVVTLVWKNWPLWR